MTDNEIILYQAEDGAQVRLHPIGGAVWLTQSQIAELYGTSVPNVVQTISRVLADGEVDEATINSELIVRTEGSRHVQREVKVYNLEMVLAVGYCSASPRAVQFRQWATSVLREYLVKGFAMDDDKLKDIDNTNYFDELLERIRSIRPSEKRFYQKVRDLYATAVDYDVTSNTSKTFFATVQNKMLWAVTGHTAAEILKMRKGDVVVAKNYLATEEIRELDRIVTMYLDYAEDQAKRRQNMTMADWASKLDAFLSYNERDLLTHAGTVRAKVAQALAEERYTEFNAARATQAAIEDDNADLETLRALEQKLGEEE